MLPNYGQKQFPGLGKRIFDLFCDCPVAFILQNFLGPFLGLLLLGLLLELLASFKELQLP